MENPLAKQQGLVPITGHGSSTESTTSSRSYSTPPNHGRRYLSSKKIRRRDDGSPVLAPDPQKPTKTIYLIRHGQSWGQMAKKRGMDRKNDPRLRDCGLTPKGEQEAAQIPALLGHAGLESVQLVVSSPLTRALQTSVIAFPSTKILVHFHLREVGSKVPENTPRSMEAVLRDLSTFLSSRQEGLLLDVTTLQPTEWPRDYCPPVIMMERIRKAFQWIYHECDETVIAVVCHYNVIRSAVVGRKDLRPSNATPIRCTLFSNGELVLDS